MHGMKCGFISVMDGPNASGLKECAQMLLSV